MCSAVAAARVYSISSIVVVHGLSCSTWHVASSWTRDWTCVSYIGRWILYHWATSKAPFLYFRLWSVGCEFTLSYVMGTVLSALHAFFSNSVLMTVIWYVGTLAISILQRRWKPMVMKSLSNIHSLEGVRGKSLTQGFWSLCKPYLLDSIASSIWSHSSSADFYLLNMTWDYSAVLLLPLL